jgi:hypothetical protein
VAGFCENGNELYGFVKGGEIFDQVSTFSFSRKYLLRGYISCFALRNIEDRKIKLCGHIERMKEESLPQNLLQ